MPHIYDITNLPVAVSDERARAMVAALGLTLTEPLEISGVGITITVAEELSPAQLTAAQGAIRDAVLASIGTITQRT